MSPHTQSSTKTAFICLMMIWVSLFFFQRVEAVELKSLTIHQEKDKKIQLSFFLNGPFAYKAFILKNPNRVVVDIAQGHTQFNFSNLKNKNALFSDIRSAKHQNQALRIVFDLSQSVTMVEKESARMLQLELSPIHQPNHSVSHTPHPPTPIPIAHKPPQKIRDVVIVLDPGHGGKDPGAIGPKHHKEKDLVLAIALKLKALIDKEPGVRAVLTRDGDYYVGLRERLNIARKHDADIFISIHADAFINRHSNGASVFALSPLGATSEAARWLAEKENYSELGGVNLSELDDENGLIRTVLLDLSQTATIGASLQMGEKVLSALDQITNLHHDKVEQARFVVLKSPDIPSILIETGFISNPREERNLISTNYQYKLTRAIFQGIKRYFYDYPPQGTYMEANLNHQKHMVKPGETLTIIAKRYRTTVASLKQLNHLSSDHIHAGQTLQIAQKL